MTFDEEIKKFINLEDLDPSSPMPRKPGPATPEELRIISKGFDILIFCCQNKVDFPCADGKGEHEYKEMRDSLRALADEMEAEGK